MRNECSVIRDILPLYTENMVSSDTASWVEEHLRSCDACRKAYEQMKAPRAVPAPGGAAPLLRLKKKLTVKKIQTVILTAVFVATLLASAFAVLDTPVYLPYTEGLITVEEAGGGLRVTFGEEVTDFRCTALRDPDQAQRVYYDIEAWSSLWDRWFTAGAGRKSVTLQPEESYPVTVMYSANDGSESVCVYGEAGNRGVTAPRLALGYYFILAALALAAAAVVRVLVRRRPEVRVWVERVLLYPVAYMISHVIVAGFSFASYALSRDFLLIVFVSLLLYCGLVLIHSLWRLQKEIRQING